MTSTLRILPFLRRRHRPWRLVERNVLAYRRIWYIFLSGFVEPLFFLLSIGIGVGKLVGDLDVGGHLVPYRTFVAPGLLAIAAMTGSLLDTTFNFFVKMKYAHTYDGVLATPLSPRDVATGAAPPEPSTTAKAMRTAAHSITVYSVRMTEPEPVIRDFPMSEQPPAHLASGAA